MASEEAFMRDRWETLFDAIAHGDDEHRAWLKQAIEDHFAGRPVQPVRGKGRSEARLAEIRAMRAARMRRYRANVRKRKAEDDF